MDATSDDTPQIGSARFVIIVAIPDSINERTVAPTKNLVATHFVFMFKVLDLKSIINCCKPPSRITHTSIRRVCIPMIALSGLASETEGCRTHKMGSTKKVEKRVKAMQNFGTKGDITAAVAVETVADNDWRSWRAMIDDDRGVGGGRGGLAGDLVRSGSVVCVWVEGSMRFRGT